MDRLHLIDWSRGAIIVEHAVQVPQGLAPVVDRLRCVLVRCPSRARLAYVLGRDLRSPETTIQRRPGSTSHTRDLYWSGLLHLREIAHGVGLQRAPCQCRGSSLRGSQFLAHRPLPVLHLFQRRVEWESLLPLHRRGARLDLHRGRLAIGVTIEALPDSLPTWFLFNDITASE